MAAKRTPSGKSRVGEMNNQSMILSDVAQVIGSQIVDLKRAIQTKRGSVIDTQEFVVIGLLFEDAGGAAAELAQRLSSVDNGDGTFTIYAEKCVFDTDHVEWDASTTTAVAVRWTVLVTN